MTTQPEEPETLPGFAKTLPTRLSGWTYTRECPLLQAQELLMLAELWGAALAQWECERHTPLYVAEMSNDISAKGAHAAFYRFVIEPLNLTLREDAIYHAQFMHAFWRHVVAEVER